MKGHTPGPWHIGDGDAKSVFAPSNCKPIARTDSLANARLIAAAPEMLEALKKCLDELERLNKHIGWRDGEWHHVTITRAAIAKAQGR